MTNNEKITYGCDLCIANLEAYENLCREHNVSRAYDAPNDAIYAAWIEHCYLTKERAQRIVKAISAYNFNNVSKQIKAKYSVYSSYVTLTINNVEYGHADYTRAITVLRTLGLRISYNEDK